MFEIDLSLITDSDLQRLASFFGRAEYEFADRPEIEEFSQQLRDILQAEYHLRQLGLGATGPQFFDLVPPVALGAASYTALQRVFSRWAAGEDPAKKIIGRCVLRTFMLE